MRGRDFLCGLDVALDVVGGKWKALIIWALGVEPRRTGELRRELEGVSEKMLIQQLRELESDGVVARTVHDQVPPKVVYSLDADRRRTGARVAPARRLGRRELRPGEHYPPASTRVCD